MNISDATSWMIELRDSDELVHTFKELSEVIARERTTDVGTIAVSTDLGPRPFWQRLLGAKRWAEGFFVVEWASGFARLIFYDEDWSEYRALDKERRVEVPESIRVRIANGERLPCPLDECMEKDRAFLAIEEYMASGARPTWLQYRYVE